MPIKKEANKLNFFKEVKKLKRRILKLQKKTHLKFNFSFNLLPNYTVSQILVKIIFTLETGHPSYFTQALVEYYF